MLKLSHDGIAEDADLVSVWDRLAARFRRTRDYRVAALPVYATPRNLSLTTAFKEQWGGDDTACGEVVS